MIGLNRLEPAGPVEPKDPAQVIPTKTSQRGQKNNNCGRVDIVRQTAQIGRNDPGHSIDHVVFDYDPKGEYKVFSQVPGKEGRCIKQPDNEKPSGEWNTVELVCFGEDCIHIVNGRVVMRLHAPRRIDGPKPLAVTSGPIILQSEGAEVFYREIE